MTLIIVTILLIGYFGIATEHVTNINKAAVAMFLGVIGWTLFMLDGPNFVLSNHAQDFQEYIGSAAPSASLFSDFIANHIFLKYAGLICGIVLYFIATMSIVNVLNNNGAFDFIAELLRTRNSKKMIWITAFATYIVSANLDNLTTTALMVVIIRKIIPERRERLVFDCIIVLAANCGGCFTAIGDITSLMLWINSSITPSSFAGGLFIPSIVALAIPTWIVSRMLPEHITLKSQLGAYQGDDYSMNRIQRFSMLFVGICGLWAIPTFHSVTKMPPFVGALCVLSIIWVMEEIYTRQFLKNDAPIASRHMPRGLRNNGMQTLLFVVGVIMSVGAVKETGALDTVANICNDYIHNIYILSVLLGLISSFIDNALLVFSGINIYPVLTTAQAAGDSYMKSFVENGAYWQLLSYCGAVGGSILTIGSLAGFTMMKVEQLSLRWYIRHFSWIVLVGWIAGLLVYWVLDILTK